MNYSPLDTPHQAGRYRQAEGEGAETCPLCSYGETGTGASLSGNDSPLCFALHSRRNDAPIAQCMEKARQILQEAGAQIVSMEEVQEGCPARAMLVFGGDGTLLHAARLTAPLGVPVLGVNFGQIGYLCTLSEKDLEQALTQLIAGQYRIDRRTMLECSVIHEGEIVWQTDALNDFLIGGCNRTVRLEVSIDGHFLGNTIGDGLILATSTGSTAYSFNAGGPAMLTDTISLVASNSAFSSPLRSLVLPREAQVCVINHTREVFPFLVADGQKNHQLQREAKVKINCSPHHAHLVDLGLVSHVEMLRQGFLKVMQRELGCQTNHPLEK